MGGRLAVGVDSGWPAPRPSRLDVRRGFSSAVLFEKTVEELRQEAALGALQKIQRDELVVCNSPPA
jgi:hypothetical protein